MNRLTTILMLLFLCSCTKADVSGKWEVTLTPENGNVLGGLEMMLIQKGQEVTGTMTIREIGAQMAVKGSMVNNKLSFATELTSGLYISYSGEIVNGNRSDGSADVVMKNTRIGDVTEKMRLEMKKL